jgi:SAM-dependent methyltransferase
MSSDPRPVEVDQYTEEYFLERVGGAEFFRLYGPRIVKPALAYALHRADLKEGMTALDMGCGRGELLYQLNQRGVAAVGADFAPAALRIARKISQAPVVRCDAKKLPFKSGSFDRIFFLGVLDHLHDWELESGFAEFKRLLKPGGCVLADTCANKDYYKYRSYEFRRCWAKRLGLNEPSPPRSDEDRTLHVNEHDRKDLEKFFLKIGWRGDIEAKPNEKYLVKELYGDQLPDGFPLKSPSTWKRAYHRAAFSGPWKKYLAREWFCKVSPQNIN